MVSPNGTATFPTRENAVYRFPLTVAVLSDLQLECQTDVKAFCSANLSCTHKRTTGGT